MSEGKGYVYVEEYPEYIRKHLISFNFFNKLQLVNAAAAAKLLQ